MGLDRRRAQPFPFRAASARPPPPRSVSPASHAGTKRDSVRSGAWNQQLAAAMLLPRPDRETRRVDDQDDLEALWGLAAALPPSLAPFGIVPLLLAAHR